MASSHIIYLILFLKNLILINEIKSFKSKIYKINYMVERRMSWKLSCTVWVGGKSRDNFKRLPINISLWSVSQGWSGHPCS